MSEIGLKEEIGRLRDLLIDNGIDPDPSPPEPEPEQFGPPTAMMWGIQRRFERAAAGWAAWEAERIKDAEFWELGQQWSPEQVAQFQKINAGSPG